MILAASSFILVFAAMTLAYLLLQRHARHAVERLQTTRLSGRDETETSVRRQAVAILIRRDKPDIGRGLRSLSSRLQSNERLARLMEKAGVRSAPSSLIRKSAIAAVIGGAAVAGLAPRSVILLSIPIAVLCGALPFWQLKRKVKKRVKLFEEQFPDGLEFVSRSMRAGHAFSVSLEMLYREFEEPMAGEFRRMFEEQNLGMPLETALGRFAARMPLLDVQFFTSAVILQRKTGGNLTEILDKLAQLIRERQKLRGKIAAVSAHGRMTGKVLSAIPAFVGALMFFVNRDYAHFFLETQLGQEMMAAAFGLQIVGYLTIRKLVCIEI
jgi:tight adherence protein B